MNVYHVSKKVNLIPEACFVSMLLGRQYNILGNAGPATSEELQLPFLHCALLSFYVAILLWVQVFFCLWFIRTVRKKNVTGYFCCCSR